MQSSSCHEAPSIFFVFVLFSLLFSSGFSSTSLRKINRPFVKSIKSPDGDIIDCVLFHRQPAFDVPKLKGKMSMVPPELPKGHDNVGKNHEIKQLWNSKGESCPNGTIPIKRPSASDISRSTSVSKYRKKYSRKDIPTSPEHQHAIGYSRDGEFYGAKALLNVWQPNVSKYDFSLSQIWVLGDVPNRPVNSIEAGWHVSPNVHKDSLPRLFTYWTPSGYKSGCYNMECPGFVQTNQKVSLGAAIDPISTYNGQQYDVDFLIWRDPKTKDWWLRVGTELMGFWPADLFTDLHDHATTIEYGGEVFSQNLGTHTRTQMGSGHFQDEGFGKAAYARNLEVITGDNHIIPVPNLRTFADDPNCYGVKQEYSDTWGNYIFFGGPGYNPNCL
ncbi:putative neprosin [Helianthus annuus]|uniref:Neprosin n=1 Tax=Helianthus annuus TaxID=4232 RepID=A0A251SYH4_HELAN|nr:putative neprosin [Helianthus annuus]KAJ0503760.1 putative neprosin [Helianthus annuus]